MPGRSRSLIVASLVAAAAGVTGCGGHQGRTALAVEHTRWASDGTLVVQTECIEESIFDAEAAPDRRHPSILNITMWGEPTVGRCHPELRVPVDQRVTTLRDAASNRLVELPPRP